MFRKVLYGPLKLDRYTYLVGITVTYVALFFCLHPEEMKLKICTANVCKEKESVGGGRSV